MKTQIRLRLKEFTIRDFSRGLELHRNVVSDARVKDLYRGVNTLLNKYYWVDKSESQSLTYKAIYSLLSGETLVTLIESSGDADATKKKSFEIAWYLVQSLDYPNDIITRYSEKFKEYNRKTKVNRNDTKSVAVISDGLFAALRTSMENAVSNLTISLTATSHIETIMRYQRTILMILLVEYPTRPSSDYYFLRNRDDSKNGYYNGGKIYYRSPSDGAVLVTIDIPSKYLVIFESYHTVAKDLSEYFFFGERNKGQVDSNNFPNVIKKLLGVKLSDLKHKWDDLIESKRGTEEHWQLVNMARKK